MTAFPIIELHLLQSFPVSNLNRDDLGQPKNATFGGAPRSRVSSQALKRSVRTLFPDITGPDGITPLLPREDLAVRTKRLARAAAQILDGVGPDTEPDRGTVEVAGEGLLTLGFGLAEEGRTEYLLFVGAPAAKALADYCNKVRPDLEAAIEKRRVAEKKAAEAAEKAKRKPKNPEKLQKAKPDAAARAVLAQVLDARRSVDIALFGRMIADNSDFNVDAASQVAHALSTHQVATEFDYYTAIDDLKTDAEPGADMIGHVDFNAACYYRYANLDLRQLSRNLGGGDGHLDLMGRSTHAWLEAFINAVPSGKQNSMAARTMPDTLLAVVRDSGAWNLANAFLKPVVAEDLMTASTERMVDHFARLRGFYGDTGIRGVVGASVSGTALSGLADDETVGSVADFTDRVLRAAGVRAER